MKVKKKRPRLLFKYGGNAMTDKALKKKVLENIVQLRHEGFDVIISHGGGPFIKKMLDTVKLDSEFIEGQRVTTPEAFEYIEMVLKGHVNSDLVNTINVAGGKAVGLSGKDGQTVIARKRMQKSTARGKEEEVDLGQVGEVAVVDGTLIDMLIGNGYIPVIACIAADEEGVGYNINGDTFAGTLAGALHADEFIVLTDVDGIMKDKNDPGSVIRIIDLKEIRRLRSEGVIQGGMIPKIEACENAIKEGVKSARILNGTKPEQILFAGENKFGTLVVKK